MPAKAGIQPHLACPGGRVKPGMTSHTYSVLAPFRSAAYRHVKRLTFPPGERQVFVHFPGLATCRSIRTSAVILPFSADDSMSETMAQMLLPGDLSVGTPEDIDKGEGACIL